MSLAVILGSAFEPPVLGGCRLDPFEVDTAFGRVTLHRWGKGASYVLFRHGAGHRFLPNQIPYRAHATALSHVGCDALLVTSSVGVLDSLEQILLSRFH